MKPLDQFDDETNTWLNHWAILYLPIGLFIVGVLMRLLHMPYSTVIMATGLFTLLLRSIAFFFRKKRDLNEWIYFIARTLFTLVLGIQLAFQIRLNTPTQIAVIGLFVLGAYVKLFAPIGKDQDTDSEAED